MIYKGQDRKKVSRAVVYASGFGSTAEKFWSFTSQSERFDRPPPMRWGSGLEESKVSACLVHTFLLVWEVALPSGCAEPEWYPAKCKCCVVRLIRFWAARRFSCPGVLLFLRKESHPASTDFYHCLYITIVVINKSLHNFRLCPRRTVHQCPFFVLSQSLLGNTGFDEFQAILEICQHNWPNLVPWGS